MLGEEAVDDRPSYFFSDQYDLGMEYTGDIGPAGYDQVLVRRYPQPGELIVFWLSQQTVLAGMNVNVFDVADDIQQLVSSARPVDPAALLDPTVPLSGLI
jgi:3-phenylpropionate/trans-cinnamate dioxygenase ferredoxin reductase subunit